MNLPVVRIADDTDRQVFVFQDILDFRAERWVGQVVLENGHIWLGVDRPNERLDGLDQRVALDFNQTAESVAIRCLNDPKIGMAPADGQLGRCQGQTMVVDDCLAGLFDRQAITADNGAVEIEE